MGWFYKSTVRPILFRMDPEDAHELAIRWMSRLSRRPGMCGMLAAFHRADYGQPVEVFGLRFRNPVGLAAGMDKDGTCAAAMQALGFGFAEVGTVTPVGQPGNPRPRLFRFPREGALINRMGFNNQGADAMARCLAETFPPGRRLMPLGVNIGKGRETPLEHATEDYLRCLETLAPQADFFVVNVSSPNTRDLRRLQEADSLRQLCRSLRQRRDQLALAAGREPWPLLLKIAPDNSDTQVDAILEILDETGFAGIVAGNTTVQRPGRLADVGETGGLSGAPLEARATELIGYIHRQTGGQLPIVGVGGIHDLDGALAKMAAGASLIQIYTSFVYEGPGFPSRLARGLAVDRRRLDQ